MKRRNYIQITGLTATSLIAGCLGNNDNNEQYLRDAERYILTEGEVSDITQQDYEQTSLQEKDIDFDGAESNATAVFKQPGGTGQTQDRIVVSIVVFEDTESASESLDEIKQKFERQVGDLVRDEDLGDDSFSYPIGDRTAFGVRVSNVVIDIGGNISYTLEKSLAEEQVSIITQ